MSEQRFGADATFSGMTSELLKLFGEKAVPLKQHAGMFLGAAALPKAEDATHDDSFDYRLTVLTYDHARNERLVRVVSRAQQAGHLALTSKVEFLNSDNTVRNSVEFGSYEIVDNGYMPELREYANDALKFADTLQLERDLIAANHGSILQR